MTSTKRPLIFALLVVSVFLLIASTQVWARYGLSEGAAVVDEVELRGQQTLLGVMPIAIALIAISIVLSISGRAARALLALLAALLGGWVVVTSTMFVYQPWYRTVEAGASPITEVTGLGPADHGSVVSDTDTTAWPLLAAAAGVMVVLIALAVIVLGWHWSEAGRKYESGTKRKTRSQAPAADRISDWDALSEGDDPTQSP